MICDRKELPMKYIYTTLLFLLTSFFSYGQRNCGSMDLLEQNIQNDPSIKLRMDKLEEQTREFLLQPRERMEGIITIPVVFHIVYNHSGENISDAQVMSQLDVMNKDFRRLNTDKDNLWPQASDAEIEFCLATRDHDGDPTCGITRTYTDSTKFVKAAQGMKFTATGGIDAWPTDQYLNIWVCDIDGLLGYAQFPGGPAETDGVVVDYRAFGTIGDLRPDFALGRTTTHEIGHWLNLRHIWGDGDCTYDDFVADTPMSDDHNYGCDVGHISCGSVDMVQNYMDYSDDVCMNLFTTGQKNRMRALFEPGSFRESLLYSDGCNTETYVPEVILEITFDNFASDISWEVRDENNNLVASTGPYSSSYDNSTIQEPITFSGETFSFSIFDSYGDGLCCNEGTGSYRIIYRGQVIYQSNGSFTFSENVNLPIDYAYTFTGPGIEWENNSNWSGGKIPSECFNGEIRIKTDCIRNSPIPPNQDINIRIKQGASLTLR